MDILLGYKDTRNFHLKRVYCLNRFYYLYHFKGEPIRLKTTQVLLHKTSPRLIRFLTFTVKFNNIIIIHD